MLSKIHRHGKQLEQLRKITIVAAHTNWRAEQWRKELHWIENKRNKKRSSDSGNSKWFCVLLFRVLCDQFPVHDSEHTENSSVIKGEKQR